MDDRNRRKIPKVKFQTGYVILFGMPFPSIQKSFRIFALLNRRE